jgi:hypothetical protein
VWVGESSTGEATIERFHFATSGMDFAMTTAAASQAAGSEWGLLETIPL